MAASLEERFAEIGFQRLLPSVALRPYIQWFWYFRSPQILTMPREEYMHPEGGFGIVFNLGDSLALDAVPLADRIFLDGTSTFSRKMRFMGQVEALGIRFYPSGAYPFLGIPLHELLNQPLVLGDLEVPMVTHLYERLAEAQRLSAKIALVEEWLFACLKQGKDSSALVSASLERLRTAQQPLSSKELADSFYISQRQLERLYQSHVGISPKEYSRLLRVQKARQTLKSLRTVSIAELGANLDYYDQAHFSHEFKKIVGMSPRQYVLRTAHL